MAENEKKRYRFTVLGRYETSAHARDPHVTVNLAAGTGDHLVFSGTFTMSEPEWDTFIEALRYSLGEAVEVVEGHVAEPDP